MIVGKVPTGLKIVLVVSVSQCLSERGRNAASITRRRIRPRDTVVQTGLTFLVAWGGQEGWKGSLALEA